jgi:putative transposase
MESTIFFNLDQTAFASSSFSGGAPNFHIAYNKEFFTLKKPRTRHIAHVRLQGDHNNNKMERMNGEIRDREKVMRGPKKVDTPILAGIQIYHNYLRPHEALMEKRQQRQQA